MRGIVVYFFGQPLLVALGGLPGRGVAVIVDVMVVVEVADAGEGDLVGDGGLAT